MLKSSLVQVLLAGFRSVEVVHAVLVQLDDYEVQIDFPKDLKSNFQVFLTGVKEFDKVDDVCIIHHQTAIMILSFSTSTFFVG